jgi:hypothetical protein
MAGFAGIRGASRAGGALHDRRGMIWPITPRWTRSTDSWPSATAQTLIVTKPISDAEREATLQKLYAWHNEWSTIARMVLTRRDHQIAVGIAKRRKAKKGPLHRKIIDSRSRLPAAPRRRSPQTAQLGGPSEADARRHRIYYS